jgi:hypothetical protein
MSNRNSHNSKLISAYHVLFCCSKFFGLAMNQPKKIARVDAKRQARKIMADTWAQRQITPLNRDFDFQTNNQAF